MDQMPLMDAIFSTHLGQFQPRPALSGPIVLRSSPDDDQDSMIARLRERFPHQCKAIVAPVTNIYQWFDQHDTYRHGYGFLHSVLATIAFQNSREVQDFVGRWRIENRERLLHSSGVMFTKAEIMEHGSGFLAEAAQQIHRLRASLQYEPSRITGPSRDRRIDFYPGRGGSVANNTSRQPRYNPAIQPVVVRRPLMPHGHRNPKTHVNQVSNHNSGITSNFIPIHVPTQVPLRGSRPHLSSRRVDFHSDPEDHTYKPPIVPSQGAPGLFPYRRIPLSTRLPQARFPSPETASAVSSSRKVFSNDARVLEQQELRSSAGNSDNASNLTNAPQPVRYPSQVNQGFAETRDLAHSTPAGRVDISPKNGPAVVFVGNKAGNGNYQSCVLPKPRVDHSRRGSEQHPSGPLRDPSLQRQWSNSSNVVTWDENEPISAISHPAVENRRVYQAHNDRNPSALDQRLNISPEHPQRSPTRVSVPNHEQSPSTGLEHSPIQRHRSGRNSSTDHDAHKVFVRNLPADFSKSSIMGLFDPGFSITDVSEVKCSQARDTRGYAFVTFEKASEAALSVKTLDSSIPASVGRRILVKFAFLHTVQHGQRRREASSRDDTLGSAMNEKPRMAGSDDLPENLVDQIRGLDSEALVGGNSDQVSRICGARESPDKRSFQPSNSINPKEKRGSKKGSISSSRSEYSKKKSVQKHQRDSSATDLSMNNKTERNIESKHEVKPNQNRIANIGSPEIEGTAADAPVIQTAPSLNSEKFSPLVSFHSTDLSKPSVAQPFLQIGVSKEPQVKPRKKETKAKENEPLVIKSEKSDREQGSNPIEMVRGEIASTPQSVPETASALVTEPTLDAHSGLSICSSNEAQVPMNDMAGTRPLLMPNPPSNTDIGLTQHVIELGSSEVDRPKATAAFEEAHVAGKENELSHTVAPSTSASNVVAKTQPEELERVPSVVSTAPQKLMVHNPTPAPDTQPVITTQSQPREDESFVTPTKKPRASIMETSPVISSTTSGQISSAVLPKALKPLGSHHPEVPLRTSSLSTPSTPIMTHKKKKKVFTPVKVDIKDLSSEIDQGYQPKDSTDLNPNGNFDQEKTERKSERSNISQSKIHIEENQEELENLQKAALPSTEAREGSHSKEQQHTTQRPVISASNLPKKSKRKASGRRQKSKSKTGQASSVVDDETTVDIGSVKPQAQKNLPEPETPYLLDNQYILPEVTNINSSKATENAILRFPITRREAATRMQAIRVQAADEFKYCDSLKKYVELKERLYEPYAAYLQDEATFSSIHSSTLLTRESLIDDIEPPARSVSSPKPPGLGQPLGWADQEPPKLRSWGYRDENGTLPDIHSHIPHLDSAPNELESIPENGKARNGSSLSSDKDIEILGTPDDSDHLPERNIKTGSIPSSPDTVIGSDIVFTDAKDHCSIPDKPLKEEVLQASDLPFRQRYSNLDSSPRAKSTMAVLTSPFSPPSPSPILSTVGDKPLKKGAFEHQIAEVPSILPEAATPGEAESSISTNVSSAATTIVQKQTLDSTSSKRDDLILDLATKTPVPSTPRGRQRKGHQRGISGSVSSSSTPRLSASGTRSSPSDPQHMCEAFAAISTRNAAKYATELEIARSQAPISPPRTPTHRPYLSYAAAALSPTLGSPTISIGEVIEVGSPVEGCKSVSGAASEDQAFVDTKNRIEASQKKKGKNSSKDDAWSVPQGETVWGTGSGSESDARKGSGPGTPKSP